MIIKMLIIYRALSFAASSNNQRQSQVLCWIIHHSETGTCFLSSKSGTNICNVEIFTNWYVRNDLMIFKLYLKFNSFQNTIDYLYFITSLPFFRINNY